jgi:hypothetical protein
MELRCRDHVCIKLALRKPLPNLIYLFV